MNIQEAELNEAMVVNGHEEGTFSVQGNAIYLRVDSVAQAVSVLFEYARLVIARGGDVNSVLTELQDATDGMKKIQLYYGPHVQIKNITLI